MKSHKGKMEIVFDGDCSVCQAHSRYLRRIDPQEARFTFIDSTDPGFALSANGFENLNVANRIYVKLPDGSVVGGMEALRLIYYGGKIGWLLYPTKFPIIRQASDALYALFARNRRWIAAALPFIRA